MDKIKVILTGITGQAGSYLSEILLKEGFEIHGVMRRSSSFNTGRVEHLMDNPDFHLHFGDLSDDLNMYKLIKEINPDYFINAGAMSHVHVSFSIPDYVLDVTGIAVFKILEMIKEINPKIKFIQFSSSELFGKVLETPQTEKTPFNPQSPYAIAKLIGYYAAKYFREAYGMWTSNCIFFNMESPRRGHTFISAKVIDYIKKYKDKFNSLEKNPSLKIGNLYAQRDWGFCPEYMDGLYKVMKLKDGDDFVFSTGETHSIKKFIEVAFREIGIIIYWDGEGINEKGIDCKTNKILIEVDPKYFRKLEVDLLMGDSSKAEKVLGWKAKTKFNELIKIMLNNDK